MVRASYIIILTLLTLNINAQESGIYSPKISFLESSGSFLTVYIYKGSQDSGIYGRFIDRKGNLGQQFKINNKIGNNISLVALPSKDSFMVVYSYCDTECRLEAVIISSNGTIKGSPIIISSNTYGFGNIDVVSDNSTEKALVVWMDYRNRSNWQIFGRFINYDGTVTESEILIIKDATPIMNFDVTRDTPNDRYALVYSKYEVNEYGVFLLSLNNELKPIKTVKVATTNDYSCKLSTTFSDKNRLQFIAYTDFIAGVNAFNIKALAVDEDFKTVYNVDVTNDTLQNKNPTTDYNPFTNTFVVAYQTKPLQGTISNIAISFYNADNGSIEYKDVLDKVGESTLLNPSLAVNLFCPNGVVVCESYDALTFKNSLANFFFGDLCRFTLNIIKSGDGTGKVISEPSGIDCGSVCSNEYKDGESVKLTAIPDESSIFNSFSGTQCTDEPVCSVVIDSNKDIEAKFILKTFQIKTSAGTGGKISPENPFVKYGSSQTLEILPDKGYEIEDVVVDNISIGPVSSYTFTKVVTDHSLSATFKREKIYYTITASASQGGTIYPSGDVKVEAGSSITFEIRESTGYYLDHIEVDRENIGKVFSYTFTNINKDHTIYAEFKPHLDEWDIDGGISDILNSDNNSADNNPESNALVTEVRENKHTSCGCTLIE